MKILVEGCLHRERGRRPSLDEIREVLQKGGQSAYIRREIEYRATEQRGYEILRLDPIGGGFFADVRSDEPDTFEEYTVVRKGKALKVPSLNAEVAPEVWIATAELRHVHQSVGHFKLVGKRWVPGSSSSRLSLTIADFQSGGHWEEYDKKQTKVQVGDFVIRGTESE